jgi:hypothetical protein
MFDNLANAVDRGGLGHDTGNSSRIKTARGPRYNQGRLGVSCHTTLSDGDVLGRAGKEAEYGRSWEMSLRSAAAIMSPSTPCKGKAGTVRANLTMIQGEST